MPYTEIELNTDLVRGECYTLSYRLGRITNPAVIIFLLGETQAGATQIDVNAGTLTEPFSQDFTYPATGGEDFEKLIIYSDEQTQLNIINDLEITLQEACADTYCSECYTLESCNDNFMLLQWTNDDNGLGFNYAQLGFIQQLRVKGGLRIGTGGYDDETYYTTSAGQRGLLYTHAKKQEEMWVQAIPGYLLDAIRIALAHDHFFIDGTEYVKNEGGFNPEWDVPLTLKAPVVVGVEEKTQDTFNQNC